MMPFLSRAVLIGCAALLPGLALAAGDEAGAPAAPTPAPMPAPVAPASLPAAPASLPAAPVVPVAAGAAARAAPMNETQQYCQNIAAAAADARFAWQRKQLNDLQAQLKQRIADLEVKEADFKAVLARREEVMRKATDNVVGIYAHMKPDAAATQLAVLEEDVAASILSQLNQRQASTILNEIPPDKAARLIGAMTATSAREKKS